MTRTIKYAGMEIEPLDLEEDEGYMEAVRVALGIGVAQCMLRTGMGEDE